MKKQIATSGAAAFAVLTGIGTVLSLLQPVPAVLGCISDQCLTVNPVIFGLVLLGITLALGESSPSVPQR